MSSSAYLFIVWYHGKCRDLALDPALDGVCGLGQRLVLTEEGEVQCDCVEVNYFHSSYTRITSSPGLVENRRDMLPRVQSCHLWGQQDT